MILKAEVELPGSITAFKNKNKNTNKKKVIFNKQTSLTDRLTGVVVAGADAGRTRFFLQTAGGCSASSI